MKYKSAQYTIIFAIIAFGTGILALILPEQNGFYEFISSGLEIIPFLLVIVLARASKYHPILRPVAIVLSLMLVWILAILTWILMIMPVMGGFFSDKSEFEGVDSEQILFLIQGFLLCQAGFFISLIPLFIGVRKRLARYIPIQPKNCAHICGLILITGCIIIPFIPILLTGVPLYESLINEPDFLDLAGSVSPLTEMYSLFWMVFIAFIASGLFIDRSLSQTISRLGLRFPTSREFSQAIIAGLALVPVFLLIDEAVQLLFGIAGFPLTNEEYYLTLFASYMTPLVAIAGAVTAGVGEELGMRGLLQPRFGIIITSLVFAALHAFQYNIDGVISVFLAGIIFGMLRNRWNTSFSAITHAVYDLVLMSLMMIGITGL